MNTTYTPLMVSTKRGNVAVSLVLRTPISIRETATKRQNGKTIRGGSPFRFENSIAVDRKSA